ncbi:MAG: hypothetical protein IT495_04595 [Gammaproteobacteria bacterium]|nr:hypothetical protein [Gammaproteobacteria bacterium]
MSAVRDIRPLVPVWPIERLRRVEESAQDDDRKRHREDHEDRRRDPDDTSVVDEYA